MLGAIIGSLLAVGSYSFGILGLGILAFISVVAMIKYRDTQALKEMAYAIGSLAVALGLKSILNS